MGMQLLFLSLSSLQQPEQYFLFTCPIVVINVWTAKSMLSGQLQGKGWCQNVLVTFAVEYDQHSVQIAEET